MDINENNIILSGLYLIKCGKYYKIGRTKNISSRMNCLRICNPYNIELVIYRKIDNCSRTEEIEKDLHNSLNKYLHKGEWFILSDKMVVKITKLIKLYGTGMDKTS